ncbi:MAG: single-stranded DNA-binding protein [Anaerolineae bacterium]|nr:single-stranded DNA-binding protein [Anaerolineae bacterium]
MHNLVIAGNLGRDPEMRYLPDGTPVCSFSVVDNGDKRAGVVWFRVTAWRRLGEVCNQYLAKGRGVVVQGRLQADDNGGPRVWTGNDGQARASFEVTAQSVEFIGGGDPQGDDGQQEHAQREPRPHGPNGGEPPAEGPAVQDEIPF